jgi:hypothetical protein
VVGGRSFAVGTATEILDFVQNDDSGGWCWVGGRADGLVGWRAAKFPPGLAASSSFRSCLGVARWWEALVSRLVDSYDDARGEALVGLARRKDERVIEPLIKELTSENVGLLALEAAEDVASPRLLPSLLLLKEAWSEDRDRHTGRLDDALRSCSPMKGIS